MDLFPSLLRSRARERPDSIAYRFLENGREVRSFTNRSLWCSATAFASVLRTKNLQGERALLVCKSQSSFLVAFYACLIAGTVAVPSAVPRRQDLSRKLQRLAANALARCILSDCDELLSTDKAVLGIPRDAVDLRSLEQLNDERPGDDLQFPEPLPDSIAFLQYTSGSTGDPKGVMVTHANLVENSAAIQAAMAIDERSSVLTALPLFHDMGLIGGILQPMHAGCPGHFMSPVECVQRPERWLAAISEHRITVSGGPNFMFELASRLSPAKLPSGLDLSSWRVAFCGAEPIRTNTMDRFFGAFEPFGFRRQAFFPCYGMAESTLFITGAETGEEPTATPWERGQVVDCGFPRGTSRVAIVDPETCRQLSEDQVGEIWTAGPSVASGYWGREDLTEAVFQARMAGSDLNWLRTGDLGFFRNGRLYVTGRLKDLIIVNGTNHSPQDLEQEAERSHQGIRTGGCAAFAVNGNAGDELILFVELERECWRRPEQWPAIESAMRAAMFANHGLRAKDIRFMKPGELPRTSSGKVRRSQCRADYESTRGVTTEEAISP